MMLAAHLFSECYARIELRREARCSANGMLALNAKRQESCSFAMLCACIANARLPLRA